MAETLFDGNVRLEYRDASDVPVAQLISKNLSEFSNTAGTINYDPQKMPKVKKGEGKNKIVMSQDDKLVMLMYLNTAATEAASGNAITRYFRIPITRRSTKTGVVFEDTLVGGDFTHKLTSAASKVHAASNWVVTDEYSVPAQQEIQLGHRIQDVRVDSAMNIYISYVA